MKALSKFLVWMVFLSMGFGLISLNSCKHDPGDIIPMPPDTTDNPVDTTGNPDTTGMPCDPDIVYFETQILPILVSNCAISGCHDPITAEEDVILNSYENVMKSDVVRAFRLDNSELFERITDNDPDDRMPPPPRSRLTSDQINVIARWIEQGAENRTCDVDAGNCNTDNVTFSGDIWPIIETNCRGCHSGASPFANIRLEDYSTVRAVAETGQLYGVTERLPGFPQMPFGQPKLPQCSVDKIKAWIDAGMPNN